MYDAKQFYDKINICCKQRGLTVTKMLRILDLSTSYGTYWKNGRVPGIDILKKIADYLNVSADFLLSDTDECASPLLSDTDQTMLKLFKQLDEHEKDRCIGRLEAYLENRSDKI